MEKTIKAYRAKDARGNAYNWHLTWQDAANDACAINLKYNRTIQGRIRSDERECYVVSDTFNESEARFFLKINL